MNIMGILWLIAGALGTYVIVLAIRYTNEMDKEFDTIRKINLDKIKRKGR